MRVALVLGSGGARGYAHIGAIREIEARGHEIVGITGASMGAVVGGIYVAGAMDDFAEAVLPLTRTGVARFMDIDLTGPGFIRAGRIMDLLRGFIGDLRIEDSPLPYTAVATDLNRQREVWFKEGPMLQAIRASIAIPGVFTPMVINDTIYIDGGVLNPLPVEAANGIAADVTIGVSLLARDHGLTRRTPAEQCADGAAELTTRQRISHSVENWLGRWSGSAKPSRGDKVDHSVDLTTMDVMIGALGTMQGSIEASHVALNPPDILIGVPANCAGVLDFHLAGSMIDLGQAMAVEALDRAGI